MKYKLPFLVGFASLAALVGVQAQTAVTDPVGYITSNVAPSQISLVAPSLVEKTEFTGVPASAPVGSTVTFAPSTTLPVFAVNQYYLEVMSTGWWSTISGNTATTVTTVDAIPGGAATEKFVIRKHVTLNSFLGANSIGLAAGTEASVADVVQFWNPVTQSPSGQYFYAGAAQAVPPGWYTENGELTGTDVADPIIEPGAGLLVTRRGATPTSLVSVGYVKTTKTQIDLYPGINVVTPLRAVGAPLSGINLDTGNTATGVLQGSDPASADTVQLSVGGIQYFAGVPANGNVGWFNENGDPSNAVVIPEGQATILTRRVATPGIWTSTEQPISTTP